MSSSLNKRTNPPPKLALSTSMTMPSDDVVLTTPDIAGTVTTPGMMDMLSKNTASFNQFSLTPITSNNVSSAAPHTITTMTSISRSPHTVQYANGQPTVKHEPNDDREFVDLDNQHKRKYVAEIPAMSSLNVVPVNMDEQERQKLERKRERNRVAATKCRQRKIQKIHVLEQEVQVLTERNNNLKNERKNLQEEVQRLESQLRVPASNHQGMYSTN